MDATLRLSSSYIWTAESDSTSFDGTGLPSLFRFLAISCCLGFHLLNSSRKSSLCLTALTTTFSSSSKNYGRESAPLDAIIRVHRLRLISSLRPSKCSRPKSFPKSRKMLVAKPDFAIILDNKVLNNVESLYSVS